MRRVFDDALRERLVAVGVDPDAPGDPRDAWARLHERFGRRATLLERYALEADARGVTAHELPLDLRASLAQEVLERQYPGFQLETAAARAVRDPIEVVPYRDEWPLMFAAWRAKLDDALGVLALRIAHIGSTAVPGLPAKPIVDIQVSVPDAEDDAAFVPLVESTGVALRSRDDGHRYFRPAGDAPRVVQVHVCSAGSTWERDHLLFRDFLRADARARTSYAALKRELAERWRDDRLAYNEGKSNHVFDVLAQAERWAQTTGWQAPGVS
jgi:GrpB-like predicted nucleotidyltransferase (UPF0157 family)